MAANKKTNRNIGKKINKEDIKFTKQADILDKIEINDTNNSFVTIKGRGGSRTAAASKMEHFVITVNPWKPLTIITKRSILDVAAVLDPPLKGHKENFMNLPAKKFKNQSKSKIERMSKHISDHFLFKYKRMKKHNESNHLLQQY